MTSPNTQRSELPPQPQHQAMPDLEVQIAEAEANIAEAKADQERWIKMVAAVGRPCRREEEMLQLATQKLHLLHKLRAVLSVETRVSDSRKNMVPEGALGLRLSRRRFLRFQVQ